MPSRDRKSTRLNSSHGSISYAVFCLKKKKNNKATAPVAIKKNYTKIQQIQSLSSIFLIYFFFFIYFLVLFVFSSFFFFFFFNDTATTEIYTLSLHDALPIPCASPSPPGQWHEPGTSQ